MSRNYNKEVALFCEQLSMILKSGISQSDGVLAIANEVEDQKYKEILLKMAAQLDEHVPFSDVLKDAGIYDQTMIQMVDIGEKSGYLDKVMDQLALYYQRTDETERKIKEAISYPSILIMMMLVVIFVLVVEVLPIFRQVLNSLGIEISSLAIALMNLGNTLVQYSYVFFIIFALFAVYKLIKIKSNNNSTSIANKLVFNKKLAYDMSVAQFAFAMSLLMNSGYDSDEALTLLPKMLNNKTLNNKIRQAQEMTKNEVPFDEALIDVKIFKGLYNRMLKIGFKAGNAEDTMSKIAFRYETEINESIHRFLNIIEPTLIALLSIVVGIILLSVMLPLMSIMSSLG